VTSTVHGLGVQKAYFNHGGAPTQACVPRWCCILPRLTRAGGCRFRARVCLSQLKLACRCGAVCALTDGGSNRLLCSNASQVRT
jgi:hypothetical protein